MGKSYSRSHKCCFIGHNGIWLVEHWAVELSQAKQEKCNIGSFQITLLGDYFKTNKQTYNLGNYIFQIATAMEPLGEQLSWAKIPDE